MESSPALFDSLAIDGDLHLDGGTLDIVFENGFLPQAGDTWNLISFTGTERWLGVCSHRIRERRQCAACIVI